MIGDTSPSHKLTVQSGTNGRVARLGNLEITTQAGTYTGSSIEVTGSNSFIKYNSTLGHKFFTRVQGGGNTLEALTIVTDTGNVGIGTTSPGSKLQVYSAASSNVFITGYGTSAQNDWGAQNAMFVKTDNGLVISKQNAPNNTNRLYTFYNDASGNAEQYIYNTSNTATIKLDSAGDSYFNGGEVGIGTTSHDTLLQATNTADGTNYISYEIGNSAINANNKGGFAIYEFAAKQATLEYYRDGSGKFEIASQGASNHISLSTTAVGNTTPTERIRIDSAGNVGIGTSSPNKKLQVGGNLHVYDEEGDTDASIFLSTGTSNVTTVKIASNGDSYINGGNVGIGTTSPAYKLDVNGGIQAGGKVTYTKQAGSLDTTGYAVAGITALPAGNGFSCGFTFTCFGGAGKYQKLVYSCYNSAGTWNAKKVIDEGTNDLDIVASANGATITFTFKARSSTQSFTPRVTVEAVGISINSTYA